MSATPRTDAVEGYHAHDDGSCVPSSVARELEIANTVLREAVELAVSDFKALELVPGMRHRFNLTVAALKRAIAKAEAP